MKTKVIKVLTKTDYDKASKQLLDYTTKHHMAPYDVYEPQNDDITMGNYIDTRKNVLAHVDSYINTSSTKALNQGITQYGDAIKYLTQTPYKLIYVDNIDGDGLRRASIPQIKLTLKKAKALVRFRKNPKVRAIKKLLYIGGGQLPTLDKLLFSDDLANDTITIRKAIKMLSNLAKDYGTSTEGISEYYGYWTDDCQGSILASVNWLLGFYTNDPDNANIIKSYAVNHHAKYVYLTDEIHISTVNAYDIISELITLQGYVIDNVKHLQKNN